MDFIACIAIQHLAHLRPLLCTLLVQYLFFRSTSSPPSTLLVQGIQLHVCKTISMYFQTSPEHRPYNQLNYVPTTSILTSLDATGPKDNIAFANMSQKLISYTSSPPLTLLVERIQNQPTVSSFDTYLRKLLV